MNDAGWLTAPACTWLGAGDFFNCFLLNRTLVVRCARHAAATAALERERWLLPALNPIIPGLLPDFCSWGVDRDTRLPFGIYPLLPGTPLEADRLAALPPIRQDEFLRQLAWFLTRLHSTSLAPGYAAGLTVQQPEAWLRSLMVRAAQELAPQLSTPVWEHHQRLAQRWLSTPALQAYAPALLHGDLSPDHLLTDAHGILSGVIDFGDSCVGDPAWDFVYILEDYGATTLERLLELYQPPEPEAFRARVQIYQQLNNLEYAMAVDHPAMRSEALDVLIAQAALL